MNGLCARVGVRFVGLEGGAAVWVSAPPGLGKRRGCAASLRDPVGVFAFCVLRFARQNKTARRLFQQLQDNGNLNSTACFCFGFLVSYY